MKQNIIATFSIVAHDPETGEWGVAVQSKFLGVGSVVPWAKAGVGAIATQAFANPAYGPEGLQLLEGGLSAEEVVKRLTEQDSQKEDRQVGVVDAKGRAASFTGEQCYDWAGGKVGKHYAAQGNILVNEATVTEMGETFKQTEGPLADRLMAGIKAAQRAGGDSRGKQSAALLVVKEKAGYGELSDVAVDLRVDDHPDPIEELDRIYQLHQLYFGETKPEEVIPVDGKIQQEVLSHLNRLSYLTSEQVTEEEFYNAFTTYLHTENFEGREQERGKLDLKVLEYMRNQE
ncbi:Uncharacterized conserved protein, Ntn-hydrolase superfamily [Halobacillus dabanensis]|uniref:Uncharacterized conserved protein, Ntn-hydrolase superfamily n=1 Tax=Halobacillus dabanensis TaxID=240302 RepID=A0A1I3UZL7_HALDA|nr:DUF1028 domain-containing protein [Halobacillus dabanensis]SFJ88668.1 Uncharacterized conserved protein, Ntn-hydrolase superfamily [Halobacillus dabanensis]